MSTTLAKTVGPCQHVVAQTDAAPPFFFDINLVLFYLFYHGVTYCFYVFRFNGKSVIIREAALSINTHQGVIKYEVLFKGCQYTDKTHAFRSHSNCAAHLC